MLNRGAHLLQENAPVLIAVIATETIKILWHQEIDHAHYSPYLAPSECYQFSKLISELRGLKFNDDDELKKSAIEHFANKSSDYLLEMVIKRYRN